MTLGPAIGTRPRRNMTTLTEFGKTLLDCAKKGIRTMVPARVVLYNPLLQKADVVLQHNIVLSTDAGESELPPTIVPQCPVAWPSGTAGAANIQLPLVPNDPGYLLVSDRSLERWITQGVPVDPASGQTHNLVDGVFHPMLRSAIDTLVPPLNPLAMLLEAPFINLGNGAISPVVKGTELVIALTAYSTAITAAAVILDAAATTWAAIVPPTIPGNNAFAAGFTAWSAATAAAQAALIAALLPALSLKSFVL